MDEVMELEIGPGPEPGSFVVQVVRSVGGGEPTATIRLDVDELVARRSLVEASVLSSSVSARRIMSDTEAAVQGVGVRLFESLFSGDIRTAYRTSTAVAAERGKGVQLSLRLDAPGLAALPWEALFDPEAQAYLCRKEPLVRLVPAPYSPAPLALTPPLRVLGMISSPRGLPALDVGGERERLEAALRPHLDTGLVELHWLDEVTWSGVHSRLLEEQWHVLHFIGHGAYDTDTDEGVLAFVGRDGRPDYVTASSLADLLDEAEPTPRLVVLNSCQSGAAGTTDLFSGTAAALAHSGIRAVAAMQFSISDVAAIEFSRAFYTALAHGRGIDEAVRSGRIGILGIGRGTLEWVTPVLYLRGDDKQLFDVAPMPASPPRAAPLPSTTRATARPPVEAVPAGSTGPVAGPIPIVHTGPVSDVAPHTAGRPAQHTGMPAPSPAAAAAGWTTAAGTTAQPVTAQSTTAQSMTARSTTARSPQAWPEAPAATPADRAAPPPPTDTRPPAVPTPAPGHPPGRGGRWRPWVVVGVIAAVAVGGGAATVLSLRADDGDAGGGYTDPADPADPGVVDGGSAGTDGGADTSAGSGEDGVPAPDANAGTQIAVPMNVDWTPTDVWCEAGDVLDITVTGAANHDASPSSLVGPDGLTGGEHPEARVAGFENENTASVIGSFRDHNDLTFGVGRGTSYRCDYAGQLYLGINDLNLDGNHGAFEAMVSRIRPDQ
jgi:hypothetical protein